MPELPEVETTRRGIEPHILGRRITALEVHERRLRWPIARGLESRVTGQRICSVGRRAKYLLLALEHGTLILHLGMSGSLRVLGPDAPRRPHDHLDLAVEGGAVLRFNDPRRFGSLHFAPGSPEEHPLIAGLGPEPLGPLFTADYLYAQTRGRRVAIKQLIMNGHVVVGVGNIYASEALFRAGLRPGRMARSLTRAEAAALVRAIGAVLALAIRVGGTTLRDYVGADGNPGYFRQRLNVYERAGEPCRRCGTIVRQRRQGQRSTYYCTVCQK